MNNPQISAYMESMGFVARPFRDAWYKVGMPRITSNQAGFLYNAYIASTRKTLEDLKESGPKDWESGAVMEAILDKRLRPVSAEAWRKSEIELVNAVNNRWKQKLDQMISALEHKGDDV